MELKTLVFETYGDHNTAPTLQIAAARWWWPHTMAATPPTLTPSSPPWG